LKFADDHHVFVSSASFIAEYFAMLNGYQRIAKLNLSVELNFLPSNGYEPIAVEVLAIRRSRLRALSVHTATAVLLGGQLPTIHALNRPVVTQTEKLRS
jgi:hypothetical protein